MDLRKLKTLIDLVAESGIAELEVTEGEDKVRIVKTPAAAAAPPQWLPSPSRLRPRLPRRTQHSRLKSKSPPVTRSKSPMVGTFY